MDMDDLRAAYPDWEFDSDSHGQWVTISAWRTIPMHDPDNREGGASVALHFGAYGDYETHEGSLNLDASYPVACAAESMRKYLEGER